MMSHLSKRLGELGAKVPSSFSSSESLWKGPEEDGITFSLLSRFLVCRERFRLLVVEGLSSAPSFNHRLEYGSMWHTCEEATAAERSWKPSLIAYCRSLSQKYPTEQSQVDHWYNVCCAQFPVYLDYWKKPPVGATYKGRKVGTQPVVQEFSFSIPYSLPSGRTVLLRGKWDSVDVSSYNDASSLFLQENKTKGDINEGRIKRQLSFDLQTMIYITALRCSQEQKLPPFSESAIALLRGIRYNVVRRPLSGGKYSIVRHKPSKGKPRGESKEEYYARLQGLIREDPSHFFMRWTVEITSEDIDRFRRECLDPILEQLCDWWEWIRFPGDPFGRRGTSHTLLHWRHPFGVYNVLDEGGSTELDEHLATGSGVGLQRVESLFPEL